MDGIEALTTFFGWCTVIDMGFLVLTSMVLVFARGWITGMHSKMFDLDESTLSLAYFKYLAHFKITVIVFNLVPWLALKAMA